MTSEELKRAYSMREVVERYGIKIKRDGMCSCPFHGKDSHASMKIYEYSFHCFACGENGDIFTFIQKMDGCDFKTAFISLGGDYTRYSEMARAAAIAKREHERNMRSRKDKSDKELRKCLADSITLARTSIEEDEPYSDRWCLAQNYIVLFHLWWEQKYIYGEGVSIPSVYRVCKRFGQEYNSAGRRSDRVVFDREFV